MKLSNLNVLKRPIFISIIILIIGLGVSLYDYPQGYNNFIDSVNEKLDLAFPKMPEIPFHLGLDLQGGSQLIYQADVSHIDSSEHDDSIEAVRDIIERRVNAFGVVEPVVQTTKSGENYRVLIELAGIKDINQAIEMIGETPLLEFKEEAPPKTELTEEEKQEIEDYNKDAEKRAEDILAEVDNYIPNFDRLVKDKNEDPLTMGKDGDLGYIQEQTSYNELYKAAQKYGTNRLIPEVVENPEGYNIVKVGDTQDKKEVKASHILICFEGTSRCDSGLTKEEAQEKINELKAKATPYNFGGLAVENSTDPTAKNNDGDLGWFTYETMVPAFSEVAFNQLSKGEISDVIETDFGFHIIYKTDERSKLTYQVNRILVKKKTEQEYLSGEQDFKDTGLTGEHLKKARLEFDPQTNEPTVGIDFNDEGKELFKEITQRNVGKRVAIYLDGYPISAPTVNEPILDGSAVISGKFKLDEAKELVRNLNAGALPVPINLISQQTVGASLGHESVNKSMEAALIGLLLVALFMIIIYRLPGFMSVLALIFYGIILLGLFKLIPVVLTLSGIAGFVLSLGMAVDANVLIFERFKEEAREGKPLPVALEEGFKRAWPSIRDGNLSTLITCFILAWLGTSFVKGFAITLGVGVVVSMFSAIIVTRVFVKAILKSKKLEDKKGLFVKIKNS